MTPEQFTAQMAALVTQIKEDNAATRKHSSELHAATQGRVDTLADNLRAGLRDDVELMLVPVLEKQAAHSDKLKDHEDRLRVVEKNDVKRQVYIGGAAGLAMAAVVEGIKAGLKMAGKN